MSEQTAVRIDRSATEKSLTVARANARPSTLDLLRRAANESSQPLDRSVRGPLEQRLNYDFSRVRVHAGPSSVRAAESVGARAYALGSDIHLGAEVPSLAHAERAKLLTHEAVHTAQQGGGTVVPNAGLAIGDANSAAEREAQQLAGALTSADNRIAGDVSGNASGDASHEINRVTAASLLLSPLAAPLVQRDLTGVKNSTDGDFDLGLRVASEGGQTGMKGTIKFKPADNAPDSANIRLLQVVRLEDLDTKRDYSWTGTEANRNKTMTATDDATGVKPGFFVDHAAAAARPRSAKSDANVSPYYRDYWPNASLSQDGSKQGKAISEASLWDFPAGSQKLRYSFETAAKATDKNYVYATLKWGFEISDPTKGEITGQYADANYVQSSTFNAAVTAFDKFYKNPGSADAPN